MKKMQMLASDRLERVRSGTRRSVGRWGRWAWQGIVEVGHNSLAVLGLACIGLVLFFSSDSALRHQVERQALEWLNLRHGVALVAEEQSTDILSELAEPAAVGRATARDPSALPREQELVVSWLSRRYRVAPEPVASLVQEAWAIGKKARLDPTLILAIVAIESSFNPFAQSPVGAQGLMQVMTRVHDDKYSAFGGKLAAFDPVANLRVGAQILSDYVARAEGSVELALKYYVGAANLPDDGGYAERVLTEQGFLRAVASGQTLAWNVPNTRTAVALAPEPAAAAAAKSTPAAAPQPGPARTAAAGATVAPAPGTVMAPALGAPVATNLSAPPGSAGSAQPAAAAGQPERPAPAVRPSSPGPAHAAQPAMANAPALLPVSSGVAATPGAKPPAAAASAPAATEPAAPKPKLETAQGEGRVAALAEGAVR